MPPKKRPSYGSNGAAKRMRLKRANEAEDERDQRLRAQAARNVTRRANEAEDERDQRLRAQAAINVTRRANEAEDERDQRLRAQAAIDVTRRANEAEDERDQRLRAQAARDVTRRANEAEDERDQRLRAQAARDVTRRANEAEDERDQRLRADRTRRAETRTVALRVGWNLSAFNYNPQLSYASDKLVAIGSMSKICAKCSAKKWEKESPGMCCGNGKVQLPALLEPPEPLKTLLTGTTRDSENFLNNIRAYNSTFQMTSFGGNVITESGFMPTFKVQGQIYHRIGSLRPLANEQPRFLQLYFIGDWQHQAEQRNNLYPATELELITQLQGMLHTSNRYVQSFKCAIENVPIAEYKIVIDADKRPSTEHARRFNLPECNEVAVLITGEEHGKRDIVLQTRANTLQFINETHRSYDALQYPLLFVYGEDGYHFQISQTGARSNKTVSCMDFYAYRFMVRSNSLNYLLFSRNLFHQFVVDMFAKIEAERLCYIRTHQKELRCDSYIHLRDAVNNDRTGADIGQICILPSSFTGSPRYMHERTQDAMTYVRTYGRPDLFITFTCNSQWQELKDELLPGQKHYHRHDLIARVFRLKLLKLMDLITKSYIFGPVRCHMYTIEWQKRGLPHAHILIWLVDKIRADQIDSIISAELPDPNVDKDLFDIVKKHMVHGPCGRLNFNSPCMKENKCSKRYPKSFLKETQTGEDSYPSYRRRKCDDGGITTEIGQHRIDNRWIVPYCPLLTKTFNAHINVEFCNSVKSIKYVCKYVNKGSDAAMFGLEQQNSNDEVTQYQQGRYISSNEALWRIFGFSIHERYPTVQQLAVHLENGQRVYFTNETAAQRAAVPRDTTLTAFFKLCLEDEFAQTLLYHQLPSYYTWNNKTWSRRKRGSEVAGHPGVKFDSAIGRVYSVHPTQQECFFLRMLLHEVQGPTCYEDLKAIDGVVCETFREACHKLGLLEDDNQWDATLEEAATYKFPKQLRSLFAILLHICNVGNPSDLWHKYKDDLAQDYRHREQLRHPHIDVVYTERMYNQALIDIEDKIACMGGPSLATFGLPQTDRTLINNLSTELIRETSYDVDVLTKFVNDNENMLLPEQRTAYSTILNSISTQNGGIYFLDAPGGTGKTFVSKLLLASVRSRNKIAVAVASSGIAATLLPGGRTAHSTFKLPFDLANIDDPVCKITKNSGMGEVLQRCELILWDECTMAHKKALEALNNSLQDLRNRKVLMGGITVVLSGDFRQTLPIIPKGTKADEIRAYLKSSFLWRDVKSFKLTTNMRAQNSGDPESGLFAQNLIKLGEGRLPVDSEKKVDISTISVVVQSIEELTQKVFPNLDSNYNDCTWLCERAILAPKNVTVDCINRQLLEKIPVDSHIYKSVDTVIDDDEVVHYPIEFLHSLQVPGLPPHLLRLKVGAPIMLLRNLDQPKLCNGTRLIIKALHPHVIEAEIQTGCGKGEVTFIPRIPLITSDVPVQFKRLQFPIKLSFAMSINKSQGQTLQVVGLQLEEDCFAHGQLYVGCSRVGTPNKLFVYAPSGKTRNVVYSEVL